MEDSSIKLWPIIRNNRSWNFKSTYDIFSDELGDILIFDASIGFCLHPLAEIVSCKEQKLLLCCCNGKGADYVHLPLCKWQRTCDRVESFRRHTEDESVSLTPITPLNIAFRILLHGGLIILFLVGAVCQCLSA